MEEIEKIKEICGKKKLKNPQKNTLQHLSVLDMKNKLHSYIKNIHKLQRLQLCKEILKNNILKNNTSLIKKNNEHLELGFISYDNKNSCYIDTTLMALFHTPDIKIITNIFFKNKKQHIEHSTLYKITNNIRKELKILYNDLHSMKNENIKCSNLRNLFSIFDKEYKIAYNVNPEIIEWTTSQQEPNDIINILLRIFKVEPNVKILQIFKKSKRIDKYFFNNIQIDVGVLMNNKIVYLKNYIPTTLDTINQDNGSTDIKSTKIIAAKLLFININRNYLGEKKLITKVIPEETLQISSNILNCVSIIIHHGGVNGGHYTCVFKFYKDDQWYHYDDLKAKYLLIGNFKNVLEWKNNCVKKNMVSCIYL